ncbi:hypothetical protein GBAR_LOCUS12315 [Geodia barretti]|uniref:Uncharacterized protein n=1 Tax=Geodia barretti TaxID=519541 RepID=A0AA35S0Y8_GEOBA|nr:hypothetical protein GBAR_LOCUS12315 [Geodia barretti]
MGGIHLHPECPESNPRINRKWLSNYCGNQSSRNWERSLFRAKFDGYPLANGRRNQQNRWNN